MASSNPAATSRTTSITQDRYKVGQLNLPGSQIVSMPQGLKTDVCIIPSTSVPQFGGFFTVDIKEIGIIHDIKLQFNASTITATAGTSNRYVPCQFWATRIELVMNAQVIATHYPVEQWIQHQLCNFDEDRAFLNLQMGLYSSATLRATKGTAAADYFMPLRTLFNQTNLPILTSAHNVQLRIYMDSLANCYAGGGSAPVGSINYCNAIVSVTRLPSSSANSMLNAMAVSPQSSIMHDCKFGTFTIAAGVTSATIVLSPIIGSVSSLFFVVRNTGFTSGDYGFTYNPLTSFAILNSSSTNIVGGQAISSALSLSVLGQFNCASTYLTETNQGATNNGAHVYIWSFGTDLVDSLNNGKALGTYEFRGSEQLQIVWPAMITLAAQIDVFAFTQSVITQSASSIIKSAM